MPNPTRLLPFLAFCVAGVHVAAQTPSLLIDASPAPGATSQPAVLGPGPADGELLLALNDGVHGRELWRTNGTTAGTTMVADLVPGPGSAIYLVSVSAGGVTLFTVDRGSGYELWRTDGTTAGTIQLLGPASLITTPVVDPSGTGLWLTATGSQWYQTDGTTAGTAPLGIPGSGNLLGTWLGLTWFHVPDGNLYARAPGQTFVFGPFAGSLTLSTDGRWLQTVVSFVPFATTLRRLDLPGQPSTSVTGIAIPTAMPGTHLLATAAGVMQWNGTSPPQTLATWTTTSKLVRFGDRYAFAATTAATGLELCLTDGTLAGTTILDVSPGPGSSSPQVFAETPQGLLFWAYRPGFGQEPFFTDGTIAGTVGIGDLEPGPAGSLPGGYGSIGARRTLLVVETTASGRELWATDGTVAGTQLLLDIAPGPLSSVITPGGFVVPFATFAGDALCFPADDLVHGREPWVLPLTGTRTPLRSYGPRSFTTDDPVLGANVGLRCAGLVPGELGAVVVGLPVPQCLPIAPLRCVHVDPGSATLLATIVGAADGTWNGAFVLQNLPATIGLDLVAQPLFLAPSMPLGLDVGDAIWWSLGL